MISCEKAVFGKSSLQKQRTQTLYNAVSEWNLPYKYPAARKPVNCICASNMRNHERVSIR